MSRHQLTFECHTYMLAGTLDTAPGRTGLLLVSGGNEIRSGAFGGQSQLAANIAKAGYPVFRFDRRGIGDSDGENGGFRSNAEDIAAAIAAFRAMVPHLERIIAFGNCDAASALMLAKGEGCDVLLLSNPWTIEQDDGALPPDAIRSRYADKLKNPKELLRLLTGKVSISKLLSGLKQALGPKPEVTSLAQDMARGLKEFGKPYHIFLATKDRTAQIFETQWPDDLGPDDLDNTSGSQIQGQTHRCEGASHAYVEPFARQWLEQRILEILRG